MPTTPEVLTSKPYIKVGGTFLPPEKMDLVESVLVEQSLHLPDMFEIRLHDISDKTNQQMQTELFPMMDQDFFSIGKEVEILVGREQEPRRVTKGEITALEEDVDSSGPPILIVRGYDRGHRLHRGRKSRSFKNMTDSDIAQKIASEVSLSADVESTSTTHDYLLQYNQTNWEFLQERAARVGYELFVDDRTLHFRKPRNGQDQGPQLALGNELVNVRVKVSSAFQVDEVSVQSWDVKSKQPIVGTSTNGKMAPRTGISQSGGTLAKSSFGSAKHYIVDRPVSSQSEAKEIAKAVYDELDGSFVEANGSATGDPKIKPGATVELKGIGQRLSGNYYVTAATHQMSAQTSYMTHFVVSGRRTNSLLELLQARSRDNHELPNVVIGVVTNNTDSDNLGRVKVKFPWLSDSDESWWARIASPMAGPDRGFYFLPEIDDEVLVSFEHGDVTRPFIVGALWNGKDKPPKGNSAVVGSSKVNERLIKTRAGHVISLDDTQGSEKISITDKTGNNLMMIESSSNKITIKADGDINVDAGGKVNVKSKQDTIVDATGDVKVSTKGSATVDATGNASVTAKGNLDLKGSQVSVQADATMSLKANGTLTIKGTVVNIN